MKKFLTLAALCFLAACAQTAPVDQPQNLGQCGHCACCEKMKNNTDHMSKPMGCCGNPDHAKGQCTGM
ncbi:MAG: hypothetical protein EBV03_13860 [Proteobacteria bacterium]|nr:hypothetical protein [Pseudomonadota bacterium]